MNKENQHNYPFLMKDDSDTDGHAEAIMDYVISWTLRWAKDDYACTKPILHQNCKIILCKLLGIECDRAIKFKNIKIWKQSSRIDLWAEVELSYNNTIQNHAILIENKYYTKLHLAKDTDGIYRNQLIVYKKRFDKHYKQIVKVNYERHYVLITCCDRSDTHFINYIEAENHGYEILTYSELTDDLNEETESDIFNEFWLFW